MNKNRDLGKHLQRDEIHTTLRCWWPCLDKLTIGTKLSYNCIVKELTKFLLNMQLFLWSLGVQHACLAKLSKVTPPKAAWVSLNSRGQVRSIEVTSIPACPRALCPLAVGSPFRQWLLLGSSSYQAETAIWFAWFATAEVKFSPTLSFSA